jgi:NAD(P)-dependent dehydrogenase (short-subunit alcohol dehydrogenase family)
MSLNGKTILITGSARRIGRSLALAAAQQGADIILHHHNSPDQALKTQAEIESLGRSVQILKADLADPQQATSLISRAFSFGPIFALVNNAAIFEPYNLTNTTIEVWNRHLAVNLTAPFLLSQAFVAGLSPGDSGRIINILDWRAYRPGRDHLPYTVSKAALAALNNALALVLAPQVTVNALALGAVLPPSDQGDTTRILKYVPSGRWAQLDEVCQAFIFLLEGPEYMTGEVVHIDGGRHLV